MKVSEVRVKNKAGVIPYTIDEDGKVKMMFMVPSDPKFGGPNPQVAKGEIDEGENAAQAAIREGEEELGLIASNIADQFTLPTLTIAGLKESYKLTVVVAQVRTTHNFRSPHYETGSVHWLTLDQYRAKGRRNQIPIVEKAFEQITKRIK